MSYTTRLISERNRSRSSGGRWRRRLAICAALVALAAAISVFSRDIHWRDRSREARQRGLTAYRNGHHQLSRAYFEAALADNPYDWQSHLDLAKVLFRRLNELDGALEHYLYTLAYSHEPAVVEEAREAIDIIRLIRSGVLENPHNAIEDMFLTAERDARAAFIRRLSPPLREDGDVYWDAWRQRGRGKVSRLIISSDRNGFYDASIELEFPDDTSMSMHLMCPLRDIWRLELSFP